MAQSIGYEIGADGLPLVRKFYNTRENREMTGVLETRPGGMTIFAEIDPVLAPAPDLPEQPFVPHDTPLPGQEVIAAPASDWAGSEQVYGASAAVTEALQGARGEQHEEAAPDPVPPPLAEQVRSGRVSEDSTVPPPVQDPATV